MFEASEEVPAAGTPARRPSCPPPATAPVMDNELIHGARPPRSRYMRREGDEPLKGYRLVAPLGIGGFGEVWKCRAPGGVLKAMKIVPLSGGGQEEHSQ